MKDLIKKGTEIIVTSLALSREYTVKTDSDMTQREISAWLESSLGLPCILFRHEHSNSERESVSTTISPEAMAKNIRCHLEGLANKYHSARETRVASEFRDIAKDARILEDRLKNG